MKDPMKKGSIVPKNVRGVGWGVGVGHEIHRWGGVGHEIQRWGGVGQ